MSENNKVKRERDELFSTYYLRLVRLILGSDNVSYREDAPDTFTGFFYRAYNADDLAYAVSEKVPGLTPQAFRDASSEEKMFHMQDALNMPQFKTSDEAKAVQWSRAQMPSQWAKELGISTSTLKRRESAGVLVVDKITSKMWRITLESLQNFKGTKPSADI